MRFLLVLTTLCLAVGCGGGGHQIKLYPVKGKVTLDGKPLSKCFISLATENPVKGGEGQFASKLSDTGEFTITTEKGASGAPAGKYKVVFYLPPEEAMKAMSAGPGAYAATPFPNEYSNVKTSPKEVEVTTGPNNLVIEIQSK